MKQKIQNIIKEIQAHLGYEHKGNATDWLEGKLKMGHNQINIMLSMSYKYRTKTHEEQLIELHQKLTDIHNELLVQNMKYKNEKRAD